MARLDRAAVCHRVSDREQSEAAPHRQRLRVRYVDMARASLRKQCLSTVSELCAILYLHTFDHFFWLSRRFRGGSPLPTSLRTHGVAYLGRLDKNSSSKLAGLISHRCESLVERRDGTDCRIWGLHQDDNFQCLLRDKFYKRALEPFGPRWQVANLMGNQVPNEIDSLGSGNGWHRDANSPQYKIMVLLSDVNSADDGAFAFIPKSHKMRYVLRTFNHRGKWSIDATRWSDTEISLLFPPPTLITGKAGDIFAFNGALLHRGLPNHGATARIALTFYLFPKGKAPPHLPTGRSESEISP